MKAIIKAESIKFYKEKFKAVAAFPGGVKKHCQELMKNNKNRTKQKATTRNTLSDKGQQDR